MGLAQAFGALWDSRGAFPVSGPARAGILPRFYLKAVGQPTSSSGHNRFHPAKDPKTLKALPPRPAAFLRKTEGSPPDFASCGMPVITK